jgi:outer membrane protein
MKAISLSLIFLFAVGIPGNSWAADDGQPLTLGEAIAVALKHNPQVAAAMHAEAAAAYQVTAARSGLLPQIYASETFNHTNSPLWAFGTKLNQGTIQSSDFNPDRLNNPDAVNNFATALSLSWNLYDGGQTRVGWDQARQGEKIAALNLDRSEQQTIAQVAQAYVGLLLADENQAVIVQALETAQAHLKLIQDRFRSGLAVKSDVLRAQVRIADLEQQRLMAGSQIQVAQAMLHAAMGQPDSGRIAPTTPIARCIPTDGALDQWIERAMGRRPDLKQVALQEDIAEKEIARARAGHYPTLALQGNYEINSEDFSDSNDNYALGAVLRVNLYSGQRISSQAAAAKSMLAKVQALRKAMELGARVQTQRAFYNAQSSWQSIAVASQAVDQAEEGLRIVANRYSGGLLTIVDLLDAQTALQQMRTQHFKALHDYKVARIELALAAGTIDKDFE